MLRHVPASPPAFYMATFTYLKPPRPPVPRPVGPAPFCLFQGFFYTRNFQSWYLSFFFFIRGVRRQQIGEQYFEICSRGRSKWMGCRSAGHPQYLIMWCWTSSGGKLRICCSNLRPQTRPEVGRGGGRGGILVILHAVITGNFDLAPVQSRDGVTPVFAGPGSGMGEVVGKG